MLGLAIHTSSPGLGLALGGGGQPLRSHTWPLGRDLSTQLHTHLQDFIAPHRWADLAYIAVAKGPGGFTGTRIGVVTARTLAQQLEIPLFGISSLAAMVPRDPAAPPPGDDRLGGAGGAELSEIAAPPIAVELPAQRGDVFGAIYTATGSTLQTAYPDTVLPQADWEAVLAQWPVPCDRRVAAGDLSGTVTAVLTLAQARWHQGDRPHWSTVLPFYGQHPVQGMG